MGPLRRLAARFGRPVLLPVRQQRSESRDRGLQFLEPPRWRNSVRSVVHAALACIPRQILRRIAATLVVALLAGCGSAGPVTELTAADTTTTVSADTNTPDAADTTTTVSADTNTPDAADTTTTVSADTNTPDAADTTTTVSADTNTPDAADTTTTVSADTNTPGSTTFASVAVGPLGFLCGLLTDGTIKCWTDLMIGIVEDLVLSTLDEQGREHEDLARAADFLAAIDWTLGAPEGRFASVSMGGTHSCGLKADGAIICWRWTESIESPEIVNSIDQLLESDLEPSTLRPFMIELIDASPGRFATVSSGQWHSCGVRTDDTITCWMDDSARLAITELTGLGVKLIAEMSEEFPVLMKEAISAVSTELSDESVQQLRQMHARVSSQDFDLAHESIEAARQTIQRRLGAPSGKFKSVSVGGAHSCGLRVDGTVECWGDNDFGELDAPLGQFSAVSSGGFHTCGLRVDGTVECWGDIEWELPPGQFTAVSSGGFHTCGLMVDGAVECSPGFLWSVEPPAGRFESVSVGGVRSCGLRVYGTIECWPDIIDPMQVASDATLPGLDAGIEGDGIITAGNQHSCGLRTYGTIDYGVIECWGDNHYGQLNAPSGGFAAVSAGGGHSCGMGLSGIECWGDNHYGQLNAPWGVAAVSAGTDHSCAISTGGTVECWGDNNYGQAYAPAGQFTVVSAGGLHSCGIRTDGTIRCWGYDGHGDYVDYRVMLDSPTGLFTSLAIGSVHACGLRTDGTIECWGQNGQWVPHYVVNADDELEQESRYEHWGTLDAPAAQFTAVTVGSQHSCGLTTVGTIKCWGSNDSGQADAPSGAFTAVAAGSYHSCGLRADRTIACWGWNEFGQSDAPSGRFGPG